MLSLCTAAFVSAAATTQHVETTNCKAEKEQVLNSLTNLYAAELRYLNVKQI